MASIEQLRAMLPNGSKLSDFDVVDEVSKLIGADPKDIAGKLGFGEVKGGITKQQGASSIDRYQAGLYGVGEAAAEGLGAQGVASWMAKGRQENELRADIASQRARELGAVDSWENVRGVGDFGSYAKGLAIQSLPYAAEAIAGGLGARAAMSGTRAALAGAKTVEEAAAAQRALNIGSQTGAVAASYPSAVGDVLSSQREQSGETRGGVAAALAVPYAALNAVGVEGALARGSAFRNTVNLLDRGTGLTGAAARTAATATGVGLKEGVSETSQEMLNQVGRMSVDPNEAFLSDAAQERFKESFIGGAVLGGAAGGALGGWRRSQPAGEAVAPPAANDVAQAFQANDASTPDARIAGLLGRAADPLAGRSTMYGGELPVLPPQQTPITAPAVTGGTTDVAQAATGITQAEFAAQQRQQQDDANRLARDKTFQTLGAQYSPENTGQLNIFGATLFDDAKINAFGNTLAAKFGALPPTASTVADAIAQANELTGGKVISVKLDAGNPVGAADKVMKALAKTADAFQIGHVQNVQQAATILETLSQTEKGAKLDQLNAIHYALTGEDTTGYTAAQQAQATKGAKNDKLQLVQDNAGIREVPVSGGTTETVAGGAGGVRPPEVQPVGAASVGEGPLGLQVGQPPAGGVRTSAGNVPNVGGGEAPSPQVSEAPSEEAQPSKPKAKLGVPVRVKAAGKQGAPSVQPTPAPAPQAAQRQEAKLSPAEELWNDMDATDTPYASLTPALKQAWDRAVETNQATGDIQEQIADQAGDREQENKADRLIAGVLQMVIRPYGRLNEASAQKKREFFQAFWGGAKLDSLPEIAEAMGITPDQAAKWNAELPTFLEKNSAKIISAATTVAESQGMTMRDLEQLLEGIEAKRQTKATAAAQATGEEEDTGQSTSATEEPVESDTTGEEEFAVGEMTSEGGRDEGPTPETASEAEAAPNLSIRTRKSISVQERYNAIETNNARILKTMEALEKAKEAVEAGKTPKTPVEELEARLAVEMDYAKQLYDRNKLKGEYAADFEQTEEEIAKDEKRLATEAAKKLQGKPNAVQEPSTEKVPVRKRAGSRKAVGKGNAEGGQTAAEGEAQAEAKEIKTDAEKAADAWDAVVKDIPGAPPFMALTPDEQETFIEYGEENWTRADVVAELKKLGTDRNPANVERFSQDVSAYGGDVARTPSLSRGITSLRKQLAAGSLTPEAFTDRVEALHEQVQQTKENKTRGPRTRGDLYIRQRLLEAVRKGWIDEQGAAMADWFIRQRVSLWGDLGIAIQAPKERANSGFYDVARRIVYLMKGSNSSETATHELLHHLERMMPETVQNAVRKAWMNSLAQAAKAADKGTDAVLKDYYSAVLDYHTTTGVESINAKNKAMDLVSSGKVAYDHYEHFSPSEFWAVNATEIVQGRFLARTVVQRIKQWLSEFIEKAKAVFGLKSDAAVIRALDGVLKSKGGKFISSDMLGEGSEFNAFGGVKAVRSEASEEQLTNAILDLANGVSPRKVWEQTGWYKAKDGQWRFEIDDSGAQFKGILQGKKFSEIARMEEATLDEVLEHEELFDAYPELRDVKFEVRPIPLDIFQGTQGWFDEKQNKLYVTPYARDPLSTVLHEIQHWIQSKEGFENGANPRTVDLSNKAALTKVRNQLLSVQERAAALDVEAAEARKTGKYVSTFDSAVAAFNAKDMLEGVDGLLAHTDELAPKYAQMAALDTEIERLQKARDVLDKKYREQNKKVNIAKKLIDYAGQMKELRFYAEKARAATDERDKINAEVKALVTKYTGGRDVAHEMYRLVAGEAEARNTQARRDMEFGERVSSFPEDTMDVLAANTLTSTGRGGAYMNIERMPKQLQPTTKTVVDTLMNSGKDTLVNRNEDVKHLLLAAGITEDVVNGASKYMPSAQDYLNNQYERQGTRIEHEQRIQKIEEAFEKLPTELQGTGRGSVNEFIFDSTSDSKWGYVPSYNPNIKPDDDMARRFDAMPDAAQRVIKMVFDHGYQSLRMKQQAVTAAADKEFAQRELDANGDQEILNDIAAERTAWKSKFDRLMNIKNDMPYAYLGRYGDYVAVAKSETYVDAEKLAAQGDLDATKWLEQNQSDANHYIVEFAETMAEAQNKAEQWKASGRYQQVYGAEKEVSEAFVGGSDLFMGITRLRNMLTRRIKSGEITLADQEVLTALNKTVSDLYLATVAEASAHRTAMQRKNISGADKDMMRNLATRGRADAHFLASLKHNGDITDAISNMRDEAKGDPTNARPYLNELLKRYANDINYKTPSVWSRTLTRLGHTWFLSFNPAYYLQQMTQTYVLSLPYMAGRLGYHRSLRSINAAYKDVVNLVKDTNVNEHLDFSKAPADVRDMLLKLVRMGKIDIGIDADAVVYANERSLTSSVMRKLNGVNNRIESVNRATAAVAAYRGYLQRYGANNTEAATKFAAETVSNTHGSYDGFNTPRVLNSNVGRVVGQFKRFQIIQLSMLGKLIKNAFKGASAEERMVARRSLTFIASHMAILGGALGVPFVSQIANLLNNMFGDDDEPKDVEYQLRQAIGDPTLADLLTRGVPAALGLGSLGKKLAMENVASILPFTDVDLTSRSGAEKVLVGLMGPTAALGLKAADALGLIGKGEYYKGLEQAMPSGFANAMKSYRFATEGITMRNGDVVLSPEEISMVDAAFQAIGLPTNTITQRQYRQNVEREFDKFYSTKASEIKGDYVAASREGDTAAMAEARQSWQELQDARAKNGYTRQPMSDLFKAIVAARKREASVVGGIETTKANKQFVAGII